MKSSLSRRTFLKFLSTLALSPVVNASSRAVSKIDGTFQTIPENIIIILLDTLSVSHLSLYGYSRETSPNLDKFAKRSIVYHAHYSAGNFTTPSTASLLTGTYPWTHRALHLSGLLANNLTTNNIFRLLGDRYHRTGFAHNVLADLILYQFGNDIDQHVKIGAFNQIDNTIYDNYFSNDALTTYRSLDQYLFWSDFPGSLYLSHAYALRNVADLNTTQEKNKPLYARGTPFVTHPHLAFALESLFDGVINLLNNQPSPFFAYIHLYPPHEPYKAKKEFIGIFRDNMKPAMKAPHYFSEGETNESLEKLWTEYDEFVAHTDAELGRLLDQLKNNGLLDTSYVIVTSDHGQLFERGVHGHDTPLLYQPVINIPLLISKPMQNKREDIFTPTSNIDLLPTIMYIANRPIPDFCEGNILPGFSVNEPTERSIFSVEAKSNHAHRALTRATIALIKGQYKFIHYRGYNGYDYVSELYNLKNDPEELIDLYKTNYSLAKELQHELNVKLDEVNQSYRE